MILSDLFCVIMCGSLWQLIGYYKTVKTMEHNISYHVELKDNEQFDEPMKNVSEGGGNISSIPDQQTTSTNKPSAIGQYKDY